MQIFSWYFNLYVEATIAKYANDVEEDKPQFVQFLADTTLSKLPAEKFAQFLQLAFNQPCRDWHDNENNIGDALVWEVCKKTKLIYVTLRSV